MFSGVQSSEYSLIFDASEIVVNPGERLDLNCGFKGQYRHCIWELEGAKPIQVKYFICASILEVGSGTLIYLLY